MNSLFINLRSADEILRAFCWTLVHSLWQGMLAGAVAGIIIISTKRSPARLRYNLLGSTLILFLITAGITFYQQVITYQKPLEEISSAIAMDTGAAATTDANTKVPVAQASTYIDAFVSYLNTHAFFIVLLWFIFFIAKCMKLLIGLTYVHRIRNYKTQPAPESWRRKLIALTKALGIQKQVSILQSELIKVPVSIGFLKPMILVPVGLLTHLPADQVETILLHELAHIRRKDYLINLLQSCVETIFFFNPAVIWISSTLREEREACCDDIVVSCATRKNSYLDALVSFQEYTLSSTGYAMALGGEKNYLLDRVKRLLTQENKKLNAMEKLVLLTGLIVIIAFTFIPQAIAEKPATGASEQKSVDMPSASSNSATYRNNTAPKKARRVPSEYKQMDTVPARNSNSLNFDQIRFTNIQFYPSNDNQTPLQTITVSDQNGKTYKITKEQGQITALSIDDQRVTPNELSNYNGLFLQLKLFLDERSANKRKRGQIAKIKRDEQLQQNRAHLDSLRKQKRRSVASTEARLQFLTEQPTLPEQKRQNKRQFHEADSITAQQRIVSADKPAKKKGLPYNDDKEQARVKGVIADLVQENIVADASDVESFGLRDDQFVVNGQKVANDIHQKLKTKYGIRPHYGLFYGPVKIYGPGIIMDKKDLKN